MLRKDLDKAYDFVSSKYANLLERSDATDTWISNINHSSHVRWNVKIKHPSAHQNEQTRGAANAESEDELHQFAQYLEDIQELKFFVEVNREATRKILKKFMKETNVSVETL